MECLVTGSIAGREAAGFAREGANPMLEGDCGPTPLPAAGTGEQNFSVLRTRLRETAWRYGGVVRSGEAMARGLTEAETLYAAIVGGRAGTVKERMLRQDLLSAAFSLRAILTAGLGRLESRGCFIRSDFPEQDDAHWLKNSRLFWDPSANRFSLAYEAAETA